jgi:hypothetical protein
MTREDLRNFIAPYKDHVGRGLPGVDANGKIVTSQSQWVFFDRATIERLLNMTDPKDGGIKIYFGQYDKNNLNLIPEDREDKNEYIGRISVALSAANEKEDGIYDLFAQGSMKNSRSGGDSTENAGRICPPYCKPPVTP